MLDFARSTALGNKTDTESDNDVRDIFSGMSGFSKPSPRKLLFQVECATVSGKMISIFRVAFTAILKNNIVVFCTRYFTVTDTLKPCINGYLFPPRRTTLSGYVLLLFRLAPAVYVFTIAN